jgi:serine/threonine-protein kinase
MPTQADYDFGNALIELDLVSLDAVRGALRQLKDSSGPGVSLERILLERGTITQEQAALAHMRLKSAGPGPAMPEIPGFQLLDTLGTGSAGTVYRARQLSMDRIVALKVLHKHLAKDPEYLERFLREARAVSRLSHPNLIVPHDIGEHQGTRYLVMEQVEGATLHQLLDRRGPLEESRVVDAGLQVAKALEVALRHGIVHRDVKPANILLGTDGVARLCHLGIARVKGAETPEYISPEQARGEEVDVRSDLYSLGATMYHLVTGELPFPGDSPAQMIAKHEVESLVPANVRNPRVSPELSAVLSRLMEKDRKLRLQRPSDLVAALESIRKSRAAPPPAAELPSSPTPPARPASFRPPHHYGRTRKSGVGTILAFLVIALLIGAWLYRDKIREAVETGSIDPILPPSIKSPTIRTPGTSAVDQQARDELEILAAYAKQDVAFEFMPEILRRFDEYQRKYQGETWEALAVDKRRDYLDRADNVAQAELRTIRDREKELLAGGHTREVFLLYERFPKRFLDSTPTGVIIRDELAELASRVSEQYARDKAQLEELIRSRKYTEALSALAEIEEYALPSQLLELTERRRGLEELQKLENTSAAVEVRDRYLVLDAPIRSAFASRRYREGIAVIAGALFGTWTEAELPFVRATGVDYDALKADLDTARSSPDAEKVERAWAAVLARVEAGLADPETLAEATTAQTILIDLRNGISLELFREQIVTGIERSLRAGQTETFALEAFPGPKGYFERRRTSLYFVTVEGKVSEVDPWTRLTEGDLAQLGARAAALDREGAEKAAEAAPVFHLRAGLLNYYAKSGAAATARAHAHFERAVKGGIKSVKVYLSDLSRSLKKMGEDEARARFEEAKGLLGQKEYAAARRVLEELARRTDVAFVKERRREIDAMLAEIHEKFVKGKQLEEAYRGRVDRLEGGKLRVYYDFSDKGHADMFEQVTLDGKIKGRWRLQSGCLESQGGASVSSAAKWGPRLKGDVEVEYDLVAMEDPQNVNVELFYVPGMGRHYSIVFGLDFVLGDMEERMRVPATAVIKYPIEFSRERAKLPAEWDKLKERFVGASLEPYRLEKRKKARVKVARTGKKIALSIDGRLIWEGEDGDYNEGYLLFFSDCRAQVDNLQITFTP